MGFKKSVNGLIHKIIRDRIIQGIEVVGLMENWPSALSCYFGLQAQPQVIYVFRNGTRFMAARNDLQAINVINHIWSHEVYARLRGEIQKGDTIIDIGAHIGAFSVFASTRAEWVKVYSYEPFEQNFLFLTENIRLNGLKDVKAFQLAVTGTGGLTKLYINEKRSTEHTTAQSKPFYVEVDSITLDEALDSNEIDKCDLLKMDCEGAEYEILLSARENTMKRIKKISLEYHPLPGYDIDELKTYLESIGFAVRLAKSAFLYACRDA
jgi:FkbM family methyltransferase